MHAPKSLKSLALLVATTLLSLPTACSSSIGGGAQAAAPLPSGGPVGTSCGAEGSIGCAPGFASKVRCTGGKWADDGVCAAGQTCQESKNGTAVTWTACAYPPPDAPELAAACAKVVACSEGAVSMAACRENAAVAPLLEAYFQKTGGIVIPSKAGDITVIAAAAPCFAKAASCDAVEQCYPTTPGSCSAGGVSPSGEEGCIGTVGWECVDGKRRGYDCARLGMSCKMFGDRAGCHRPASVCQAGDNKVICQGSTAAVCAQEDGMNLDFAFSCGALGLTCSPLAKPDDEIDDVCVAANAKACDSSDFERRCEGNVLMRCRKGLEFPDNCAIYGRVCGVVDDGMGSSYATCTWPGGASCDDTPASCEGDQLTFCDRTSLRTFHCGSIGMKCVTDDLDAAHCAFP